MSEIDDRRALEFLARHTEDIAIGLIYVESASAFILQTHADMRTFEDAAEFLLSLGENLLSLLQFGDIAAARPDTGNVAGGIWDRKFRDHLRIDRAIRGYDAAFTDHRFPRHHNRPVMGFRLVDIVRARNFAQSFADHVLRLQAPAFGECGIDQAVSPVGILQGNLPRGIFDDGSQKISACFQLALGTQLGRKVGACAPVSLEGTVFAEHGRAT